MGASDGGVDSVGSKVASVGLPVADSAEGETAVGSCVLGSVADVVGSAVG